ncbi:hypothetical protein D3C85_1162730 [compost metagenome]
MSQSKKLAERATSARASAINLPFSRVMICAISSERARTPAMARLIMILRSAGGVSRQILNPRSAAANTRFRSAVVAPGTLVSDASVLGSNTSKQEGRSKIHSPSMKRPTRGWSASAMTLLLVSMDI